MAETAREFFEALEARVDAAKTAGMRNSYVFEIEGAGTWRVEVNDGTVAVEEGGGTADCTISMGEETFRKLASREQSAMSAYISGKLGVRGDIGAARKLQQLF